MIEKISEMKKALDEVLKNEISSMKCYCEIKVFFTIKSQCELITM